MAEQQIVPGHVLAGLATLPAGSVHVMVTSPPFYGLRAYGTDPQVWGAGSCDEHIWGPEQVVQLRSNDDEDEAHGSTLQGPPRKGRITSLNQGAWCQRCGAWRGELGSEPTLAQYLANMVTIMRAVRRVLRPDGVAFVNIADSYAASGYSNHDNSVVGGVRREDGGAQVHRLGTGIPAKNLLLVPQRLAIALQDDGWIIRSDIILTKSAPMPGSQQDRPTTAYEHLLMLTRQPHYWFDMEPLRVPHSTDPTNNYRPETSRYLHSGDAQRDKGNGLLYARHSPGGRTPHDWMPWGYRGSDYAYCLGCDAFYDGRHQINRIPLVEGDDGRNLRECPACGETDQWADHYAAFGPFIPRFAINAACPAMVCPEPGCGAGWVREVERTSDVGCPRGIDPSQYRAHGETQQGRIITSRHTIGWRPGCDHPHDEADTVPGTVLDPFVGSGTTLLVAREMGRNAIGLELSESYVRLAERRLGLAAVPLL